jgi:hypothetical protein
VFARLSAEGAGTRGYSGAVPERGRESAVCGLSAARADGVTGGAGNSRFLARLAELGSASDFARNDNQKKERRARVSEVSRSPHRLPVDCCF